MSAYATSTDLVAAGVNNASRKFIAACTNALFLTEALTTEEAKDKPRGTRVRQLKFRLNVLEAVEPTQSPDGTDHLAELEASGGIGDTGDTGDTDTEEVVEYDDPADAPQADQTTDDSDTDDSDTEPDTEANTDTGTDTDTDTEDKAEPKVERTPTENCAAVFIGAMASGDVALVLEMFRQIRSGKYTDTDMADALVTYAAKAKVSGGRRASTGTRSSRGPVAKVGRLDGEAAQGRLFGYVCRKGTIGAKACYDATGFTVTKGSQAAKTQEGGKGNQAIKAALIADGTLVDDGEVLRFTSNWTAKSCSQAAAIVYGTNSNGRANWKDLQSGQSIRQIEETLAEAASTETEPEAPSA